MFMDKKIEKKLDDLIMSIEAQYRKISVKDRACFIQKVSQEFERSICKMQDNVSMSEYGQNIEQFIDKNSIAPRYRFRR